MGDDDIEVLGFAEKNPDPNAWEMPITYKGNCRIGCKSRGMLGTKNLLKALEWVEYHRTGPEHIASLLKRSGGDIDKLPQIHGTIMLPTDPPKEG